MQHACRGGGEHLYRRRSACMYIYIYIHIYTYTYIYMHALAYIYMYASKPVRRGCAFLEEEERMQHA
jgi:hypothetical protein